MTTHRTPRNTAAAMLTAALALSSCVGLNEPQAPAPARAPQDTVAQDATRPGPVAHADGAPAGVPVGAQPATVSRHIDGDTIRVIPLTADAVTRLPLEAGVEQRIRILLVDTPETVHPERGQECAGPEASAATAALAPVGSRVWLLGDQSDTDRYGRPLRYLWNEDGADLGAQLLGQGLARVSFWLPDDRQLERYRQLEAAAQASGVGLWGQLCPAG